MSRTSPGVGRVVAVLNFFAEHPGQAFTLTDLVRSLRLSRATCHALLAGLVEAGYLYRASDKSYLLGPALAAVGRAAAAGTSPLQVAQPEMRVLADRYDAICSAAFRENGDVVIRERAASVSHLGFSVQRGTRLPLRAPFAATFLAWMEAADAKAWLDAAVPPPSAATREQTGRAAAFGREHGYFYGVRTAPDDPAALNLQSLIAEEAPRDGVAIGVALDPDEEYQLGSLIAPVFDAGGSVAFVLALMGWSGAVSGADIERMGRDVRAACDRITGFVGGRSPEPRRPR